MTTRQNSAGARSRRRNVPQWAGSGVASGALLAALLLAATPVAATAPQGPFTGQTPVLNPGPNPGPNPAKAKTALTLNGAALNGAAPGAFTTALPNGQTCPQHAGKPLPAGATAGGGAKNAPCLGALTGRLLGMAARKAGRILSTPILVL